MAPRSTPPSEADFSPIDNEPPLRWLRRLHLVPTDELGLHRRALFLAALTWLPIAMWAAMAGQLLDLDNGESLLRHYGVLVRCLIAVPLFILAEAALHRTAKRIALQFSTSGIGFFSRCTKDQFS